MAHRRGELADIGRHRQVLQMNSVRRCPATLCAIAVALIAGCGHEQPRGIAAAVPGSLPTADEVVAVALARGRPVVLELGSNACAACRDVRAELDKLRATHADRVEIVEIDLLRQREYIARFRVQLMPTQVFYDAQGKELGRNVGRIDVPGILARLGVEP